MNEEYYFAKQDEARELIGRLDRPQLTSHEAECLMYSRRTNLLKDQPPDGAVRTATYAILYAQLSWVAELPREDVAWELGWSSQETRDILRWARYRARSPRA